MTTRHATPVQEAVAKKNGGLIAARTSVPHFPIDYDPRLAKTEHTRRALGEVQKTWTTFKKLHDDGVPIRELAKNAASAFDRTCKAIDDARSALIKEQEVVERDIGRAIDKGANPAFGDSIRRHVGTLGEKAIAFVQERIRSGDNTTASAVINAPSFLSGLNDAQVGALRKSAEKQFAPEKVEARNQLRKEVSRVEAAGSSFLGEIGLRTIEWQKDPNEAALATLRGDE